MSRFDSPGSESGHWQVCCDAIESTARRLGVDPVAFAEACQDGALLYNALDHMCFKHPAWARELAALKRAEPET